MKKSNIDFKLKFSFIAIFVLLLFTLIFSLISLKVSIKSVENVILYNQMTQFKLLNLNTDILKEINVVKDILAFGDNDILYNKKFQTYNKYKTLLDDDIQKILVGFQKNGYQNDTMKKTLQNLQNNKKNIDAILDKTLSIYQSKGKSSAVSYYNSQNILKIYRNISILASLNRKYYENVFKKAINKKQNTILIIALIFVVVILIAILLTNLIAKKFTENTKYLILAAEHVSLGTLDTPIEAESNDELEDIAKIFEYLRIEIKKNMEKIELIKKH